MDGWGRWDTILLLVAAYMAVTSLARLMSARRDQLVAQVQKQVDAQRGQSPPENETSDN